MTTCFRCHRPLTDPVSKERGMGPICAALRNAAVEKEKSMLSVPPKNWPEFDYRKAAEEIAEKGDEAMYVAERTLPGDVVAFVRTDRNRSLPHIMYHSPTGYEMGYGGSGPADLARSILADAVGLPIADVLYQRFKFEFVAMAKDRLSFSLSMIREWTIKMLAEREG